MRVAQQLNIQYEKGMFPNIIKQLIDASRFIVPLLTAHAIFSKS